MTKFGNVIHHLQMEIAKQNVMYNVHSNQGGDSGDIIVEQLITGFLAIPSLKQKILQRLMPELVTQGLFSKEETEPQHGTDLASFFEPIVPNKPASKASEFDDISNIMNGASLGARSPVRTKPATTPTSPTASFHAFL
jgi:hypothetical protein